MYAPAQTVDISTFFACYVAMSPAQLAIADLNLRLAILDALVSSGAAKYPPAKRVERFDYDEKAVRALAAAPISAKKVAQIDAIRWDVRSPAIRVVFSEWDGEENEFDIVRLSGINACSNLTSLDLKFFSGKSVAALAGLDRLETLTLGGGSIESLKPLLSLPALRNVDLQHAANTPANKSVIESLCARGVEVRIGKKRYAAKGRAKAAAEASVERAAESPSLDAVRALEREAQRQSEEDRPRWYERALQMRRALAASKKINPGAGGQPIRSGDLGGVPFSREKNVAAGVALLAYALLDAGREKEAVPHYVELAQMVEAAQRTDDEAGFTLEKLRDRAAKLKRWEAARDIGRAVLGACERSKDRESIKDAKKHLAAIQARLGHSSSTGSGGIKLEG
ncbi:MAG: hypothetical protein IPK82_18045 [Polyangiaceae bacterium]|nr:hypothetical protein [Polyangiaceae bacterium]